MSGILNSGKIAKILERLTAARAGYLDTINTNLDATVSSRAAAADYTTARAAKLDNLDSLVSASGAQAPTTSGLKGVPTTIQDLRSNGRIRLPEATASETAFDTWKTVLTETTASGVIEFMAVYQAANSSDRDAQMELEIDGNIVYTSASAFWTVTGDNDYGACLVGGYAGASTADTYGIAFSSMPFTDSFILRFKKTENAAGTVQINTRYSYYLTG